MQVAFGLFMSNVPVVQSQCGPTCPYDCAPFEFVSVMTSAAWDQSDKFMKLYVTLKGVQRLDKELVKAEYKTKYLLLVCYLFLSCIGCLHLLFLGHVTC